MIFSALTPPPVTRAVCLLLFLTGFLPAAQGAFETGEITFGEFNCVACHRAGPAIEKRLASRPSPRLGRDGARLSPAWIRAFLIKPTAETPGTLMPDMLHALPAAEKAEAAEDLTHYLVSLQNQAVVPGAVFDASLANAGKELFHTIGCVACHAPQELPANGEQPTARKAEIAELANNSVALGDLGKKFGVNELAAFLRDPLKTRPGGRMPAQRLTEKEARALAMYLLREQAKPDPGVKMPGLSYARSGMGGAVMRPTGTDSFTVDNTRAAKGRTLFERFNCAACHEIDRPGRKAAPLDQLAADEKGCLAPNPPEAAPDFLLDGNRRKELTALLANRAGVAQALSPAEQVRRTMTALNCYACHSREGQGSPTGLRRAYFKAVGTVDLGEEGAIPPTLDGVGAKLRPAWLQQELLQGAGVRPYMATRMPQFGEANVKSLGAAFGQADAGLRTGPELAVDHGAVINGLRLVGNEGLTCISCHNFAGHRSLGVPAMDLTTAPERLNSDWFRRYLLNPASLRPGTRMPSFWPDGVAANKAIFNGDTERQVRAIWSYLSLGRSAGLPPGLIPARMELVADKEPVVYRNFIQGAGSRAIGVGYPEKLDLAFDANEIRLALLWQGPFIDASRHRTGRGEGYEPPLGYNVLKLPDGAPFARLENIDAPWPAATGKAAGYQFRGYLFDAQRRPKFLYEFDGAGVDDFFLPEKPTGDLGAGFRRTLTVSAAHPGDHLWFRAAAAEKIEDLGKNTFLINGSERLAFPTAPSTPATSDDPNQTRPVLRKSGGRFELLAPVVFENGKAEIVEEILW